MRALFLLLIFLVSAFSWNCEAAELPAPGKYKGVAIQTRYVAGRYLRDPVVSCKAQRAVIARIDSQGYTWIIFTDTLGPLIGRIEPTDRDDANFRMAASTSTAYVGRKTVKIISDSVNTLYGPGAWETEYSSWNEIRLYWVGK